jgi:HAD superfamily hydrolase (TIGR01509 family)
VKAVLWDLDDTLLETLPGRMLALAYAYEECLGAKTDPLALWRSHRGGTLEDLGRRLLGENYRRFTTLYREHYYGQRRRIAPYAGVERVLRTCREAEVPMAVVTSKVSWGATDELGETGILQYFGAVVGFDDTELHKPDPEPLFAAMDRLLIDDLEQVLFIGDSPADIMAARNAGCQSVAATWGTLDAELLLDAYPDHVVHRPEDVLEMLWPALKVNG